MLYDRVMRATPASPAADVAIVAIDDASIAKLGEWPWPRDVHASLIARLTAAGARVVAFSVPVDTSPRTSEAERLRSALALLESSDLGGSEQAQELRRLLGESSAGRDPDAYLAQAIRTQGNVVLPRMSASPRRVVVKPNCQRDCFPSADAVRCAPHGAADIVTVPAAVLRTAAAAIGHTLTIATATGPFAPTQRRCASATKQLVPSLATAVAARALGVTPASVELLARCAPSRASASDCSAMH
jgi:serine/threonine-protein kinase